MGRMAAAPVGAQAASVRRAMAYNCRSFGKTADQLRRCCQVMTSTSSNKPSAAA